MAGVVLGVVGVPGQIGPRQRTRVQVADALVVRKEIDPLAHPHGRGEVPVELVGAQQQLEVTVASAVDPEAPALPPR